MVGTYIDFRQDKQQKNQVQNEAKDVGSNCTLNGSEQIPFKRDPLPIDRYKRHILEILGDLKKTAIFIGETASGKSTQIPQFCHQVGLAREGMIAVTQPRRVAARTLAMRVALEMNTKVGHKVGYKYRFDSEMSKDTQILYLTEGMLLREALNGARLRNYSLVILDEVHERTINTDVLLYVLKQAQKERRRTKENPLRLILMSATMDARRLSEYFGKAPIYYIQGRLHSVKLFYAESLKVNENDYLFNAITTVLQLHEKEPKENGFLVFLTGQEEIDIAIRVVRKQKKVDKAYETIMPAALYAAISQQQQQQAFAAVPEGTRKVVFATNIAETSITIPGISVIIDSGKVKRRTFSPKNRMDLLQVENISKAQSIQRAGRAGRESPGKCYRLYSQQDYSQFSEIQVPELLRSNLSTVFLHLVELGMSRVQSLSRLLDPPEPSLVHLAIEELLLLQALQLDKIGEEPTVSMTEHGVQLLKFPIEPAHAKILHCAAELDCLEEACTVVAFLSTEPIFMHNNQDLFCKLEDGKYGQEEGSNATGQPGHTKFYTNDGDQARLLKLFNAYKTTKDLKTGNMEDFFKTNEISKARMDNVMLVRKQLFQICRDQKLQIRSTGNNYIPLRQAICKGLRQNLCTWDPESKCYRLERNKEVKVRIHPSSCMANQQMTAFVFAELVQTNEVYARDICPIQLDWLKEANTKTAVTAGRREMLERIKQMQLVRASPCSSISSSSSSSERRRKKALKEKEAASKRMYEEEEKEQIKTANSNENEEKKREPTTPPQTSTAKESSRKERTGAAAEAGVTQRPRAEKQKAEVKAENEENARADEKKKAQKRPQPAVTAKSSSRVDLMASGAGLSSTLQLLRREEAKKKMKEAAAEQTPNPPAKKKSKLLVNYSPSGSSSSSSSCCSSSSQCSSSSDTENADKTLTDANKI